MEHCVFTQQTRETIEAIVGAVTRPLTAPGTLLLGRYDTSGHLHSVGRTATLTRSTASAAAALLTPAAGSHPWTGSTFSAGWGSHHLLDVTLVTPDLVVEVSVDVVAMRRAGGGTPPASTAPDPTSNRATSHDGLAHRADEKPRLGRGQVRGPATAVHPARRLEACRDDR